MRCDVMDGWMYLCCAVMSRMRELGNAGEGGPGLAREG